MKNFSPFGKVAKYKKFTYEPRYFNPEEEERQERYRQIQAKVKGDNSADEVKGRIATAFKSNRRHENKGLFSFNMATSSLRMLIFGILLLATYIYFEYGDRLEDLTNGTTTAPPIMLASFLIMVYFVMRNVRKR